MLLCCLPVFHPRSRHELHFHPFPLSYPPGSPCPQLQPHGPARQTHACHQIRCLRSRHDRSGPRPGRRQRPPFCRGHRGRGHLPAPGRPGPDHPAPAGLPERRRLAAGQRLRPDAPHHRFRGPGKGRRPEQPRRSLGRGHQAGYGHEPPGLQRGRHPGPAGTPARLSRPQAHPGRLALPLCRHAGKGRVHPPPAGKVHGHDRQPAGGLPGPQALPGQLGRDHGLAREPLRTLPPGLLALRRQPLPGLGLGGTRRGPGTRHGSERPPAAGAPPQARRRHLLRPDLHRTARDERGRGGRGLCHGLSPRRLRPHPCAGQRPPCAPGGPHLHGHVHDRRHGPVGPRR